MKTSARSLVLGLAALLLPGLVRADAPTTQYKPYLSTNDEIVDLPTGFTWARKVSPTGVELPQVRCPIDGTSLPTVRELATLIDNAPRKVLNASNQLVDLHIDQNAFPGTPPALFWTVSATQDGRAFFVDFGTGEISLKPALGTKAYVRCIKRA